MKLDTYPVGEPQLEPGLLPPGKSPSARAFNIFFKSVSLIAIKKNMVLSNNLSCRLIVLDLMFSSKI